MCCYFKDRARFPLPKWGRSQSASRSNLDPHPYLCFSRYCQSSAERLNQTGLTIQIDHTTSCCGLHSNFSGHHSWFFQPLAQNTAHRTEIDATPISQHVCRDMVHALRHFLRQVTDPQLQRMCSVWYASRRQKSTAHNMRIRLILFRCSHLFSCNVFGQAQRDLLQSWRSGALGENAYLQIVSQVQSEMNRKPKPKPKIEEAFRISGPKEMVKKCVQRPCPFMAIRPPFACHHTLLLRPPSYGHAAL